MSLTLDANARLVLNALRGDCRSRSDLSQVTGWSRNTVAARLGELIEAGWVLEDSGAQGERGRPTITYVVNPHKAAVYVAIFGWDQLHGAICGLNGEILAGDVTPFGLDGSEDAVATTTSQLARLRKHPGLRGVQIENAVIGGPSSVANPAELPAWNRGGAVASDFSASLELPVLVENDANLMALGLRRELPEARTFVFVKVATYIGAGVVIDGRLHAGMAGMAGEIGHIPVRSGADRQCACGNRGCLSQEAGARGVLRNLSSGSRTVASLEELETLVNSGDPDAVAALRTAGRDIGEALVGVVTGIAPEVVVLGGRLTQLGDHLTTGVRESLTRYTLPALSSRIRVRATTNHRIAGLRGGAEVAFDQLLASPDGVPAAVTTLRRG